MTGEAPTPHKPFEGSPERMHFEWLKQGRFRLQHCCACERAIFYPRSLCPHCGSTSIEWKDCAGRGTVYSATVVHGSAGSEDYNVVLVDLDEGVRLMSRVDGIVPSAVRIGMRVRSAIVPADAGDPLLVFEPEETDGE